MKKNYMKLDTTGKSVLLYGFENLNEQAFCYYSPISTDVIVLTNTPEYNDCCYAIYAKRVHEKYALISNERFYRAVLEGNLEEAEFFWVKETSSYIIYASHK